MRGRSTLAALLAASAFASASAHAAAPVSLRASFGRGARLGGSSPLNIALHVDTRREPTPVVAVRLAYPNGLGLVLSGLGLAPCQPPANAFAAVLIAGSGLSGCPQNSVMAYGTLRAQVRLVQTGQIIREYATLMVLSGPIANGQLQLVVYIDGERPFGGRFLLPGETADAGPPYGGALTVRFPVVPGLDEVATVSLTDLQLSIGAPQIVYRDHGRRYHPGGIGVPGTCPASGFPFALSLRFKDGHQASAHTTVRCAAP